MTKAENNTTFRNFKYRIYPNRAQSEGLGLMLLAFCDLYNAAIQQRIEAYERCGINRNVFQQMAELKAVREADSRLAKFSFTAEQLVIRRVDQTFQSFFRRAKAGRAGFPRYKPISRFDSADMRVGDGLVIRKSTRITIVGVPGEIKLKWHRALPAKPKTAVITRSCGKWYICFQAQLEIPKNVGRCFSPIGVDLGLQSLIALSDGNSVKTPQFTKKSSCALRKAQRTVSRRKRGSIRRSKAKLRVARISARVAAQRRDFAHKLSLTLVRRFSHIALEDLNVDGLAKGILSKSVSNAAWGQIIRFTIYKAECAGSIVALVDPCGTSQTCPDCGLVKAKTLKERMHDCECGCILDRDVAAARNILMRANFGPGHGPQAPSQRIAA